MSATATTIKLICLDRETGRETWTRTPAELPEAAASVRTGNYSGTPLILPASLTGADDDSVLVIARGGQENQFDDCYAVCLSLKTGQYRWSTYLGSAARSYDPDGSVDPSQISLADGRVFVMTNLGSVAALNPADGRILWLNSYARDASFNPQQMFRARQFGNGIQPQTSSNSGAWAHNPVVVSDGVVYTLPRDARQLFIYDADTGAEKKRLPMNAFGGANVLLGVHHGEVCLTNEKELLLVDWKRYQDGDQRISTHWSRDVSTLDKANAEILTQPDAICGRGFMTADSVFVPTRYHLVQCALKDGRITQFYPPRGMFTKEQGPGNMLITAHDVVVAGQTHVDVYTDLALVRQRFDSAIAAAPSDPQPRLGYADALFAGGDLTGSLARVDEAIELLGGSIPCGPERCATASLRP